MSENILLIKTQSDVKSKSDERRVKRSIQQKKVQHIDKILHVDVNLNLFPPLMKAQVGLHSNQGKK